MREKERERDLTAERIERQRWRWLYFTFADDDFAGGVAGAAVDWRNRLHFFYKKKYEFCLDVWLGVFLSYIYRVLYILEVTFDFEK